MKMIERDGLKLRDDITSIGVLGRRWFRKSAGHTISSARITVNGRWIATLITDGYGDYYMQMAGDYLEDKGYIERKHYANGSCEPLWRFRDVFGIPLDYIGVDVDRRADLGEAGEVDNG